MYIVVLNHDKGPEPDFNQGGARLLARWSNRVVVELPPAALQAMQKQAAGMENPLIEAGAYRTQHHRVAFRHEGKLLEPIAGQFLMDFAPEEKVVARRSSPPPKPIPVETVAELFARGIALEENPSTQSAALECY